MCLGIPGLVVERQESDTDDGWPPPWSNSPASAARSASPACPRPAGDYVIVHAGFAISRIDAAEAERVFAFLEEIGDASSKRAGGASP